MCTILTAALLSVPIVGGAGYLLTRFPREMVILASEGLLYTVPVAAYMTLTFTLVPPTAPFWLRVIAVLSLMVFAVTLVPVIADRITRRLQAAKDAERHKGQGKQSV